MRRLRGNQQVAPQQQQTPIRKTDAQAQPTSSYTSLSTSRVNNIIHLQQTIGNQAVQRLMAQNRLEVNPSQPRSTARSNVVARQHGGAETWAIPGLQREDEPDDDDDRDSSPNDVIGDNASDNNSDSIIEDVVGENALDDHRDSSANNLVDGDDAAGADDPLADNSLSNAASPDPLALLGLFSDAIACNPAPTASIAKIMHFSVKKTWLPFSSSFGSQTRGVWENYLDDTLSLPRPTRSFAGGGEIVAGFSSHHKSVEAEKEIVTTAGKALNSSALLPAPGTTKSIPVTDVVPAATLKKRLNDKADPMGLRYDSPATTIAGNLAGGIGAGGAPGDTIALDPNTRDVDGALQLSLDNTGTNLTITPQLAFNIHDTVNFCPGNLGGLIGRAETVPMSILEATEARFGPVFAADVPFNVNYPGKGTPQTVPVGFKINP